MSDPIKVSKLDAARRQLETAIILYFHNHDPISIHTLAAASHEILRTLCEKMGKDGSSFKQTESFLDDDLKRTFFNACHKPQNFFKHADWDPDGLLSFNPRFSEMFLYDSCRLLRDFTGEIHAFFEAYSVWFQIQYRDRMEVDPKCISLAESCGLTRYDETERVKFYSENIGTFIQLVKFLPAPE